MSEDLSTVPTHEDFNTAAENRRQLTRTLLHDAGEVNAVLKSQDRPIEVDLGDQKTGEPIVAQISRTGMRDYLRVRVSNLAYDEEGEVVEVPQRCFYYPGLGNKESSNEFAWVLEEEPDAKAMEPEPLDYPNNLLDSRLDRIASPAGESMVAEGRGAMDVAEVGRIMNLAAAQISEQQDTLETV